MALFLAARGGSLMVRAHGSCETETRREEELMRFHHDDEQQSIRPLPPCARRVTAASHHLRCSRTSTMYRIAVGAAPSIWRNAAVT